MTDHVKAKIDKRQKRGDIDYVDDTINHIISEYSKWAKEYKTRHYWVGKVICWYLCKKFKFDHTNKWYMHNSESFLENEAHKILWDLRYKSIIESRPNDQT